MCTHADLAGRPALPAACWRRAASTLASPPRGLPAAPSSGPPARILLWACPSRHFLSWAWRLTSIPLSLQMAGAWNHGSPEETGPCLARAQSAASRTRSLPSPTRSLAPLTALVALGWGERRITLGQWSAQSRSPQGGPQAAGPTGKQ